MGFGAGRTQALRKGSRMKYPAHGPGHFGWESKDLENGVFVPFFITLLSGK